MSRKAEGLSRGAAGGASADRTRDGGFADVYRLNDCAAVGAESFGNPPRDAPRRKREQRQVERVLAPRIRSSWTIDLHGRVTPLGQRPKGNRAVATRDRARGRRVLSAEQVRAIRQRLAGGERRRAVAKDFPVSEATIGSIGRGDSWKGVGL